MVCIVYAKNAGMRNLQRICGWAKPINSLHLTLESV